MAEGDTDVLLRVRDLVSSFDTDEGRVVAVDGISFEVEKGQTLGLVGESGCGKSVTALSIMRLLPQPMGRILGGQVQLNGRDLLSLPARDMPSIRGRHVSMIFQEPMTALNPVHRIGQQLAEVLLQHMPLSRRAAWERAQELLVEVGIPSPEIRMNEYPHQLSGGMRQRVVIAMALACRPELVIADEPTTALDVTIQAQILQLIKDLQRQHGMAVVLITHALGVIAETCDEVCVMYAGRIVERAPVRELFARPRHAYTQGLLASIPRLEGTPKTTLPIIEGMVPALRDLKDGCRFAPRSGRPHKPIDLEQRHPYREIASRHWVEACPHCVNGA